jgi:integrase
MASVFKAANAKRYTILYFDENGDRRKAKGCTDKAESERIANRLENEVSLRRAGLIDRKAEVYRDRESTPLASHIADWEANLIAQGHTVKHAKHTTNRVRRLVAMMLGAKEALIDHRCLRPNDRGDVAVKIMNAIAPARLSTLNRDKVQDAIARFKAAGWSLQTCNHYRAAAKAFSKWCHDSERTREDILRGVKGFNVKEDRRHDRRTVSLDELRTLIEAAEHGPIVMRMTGPQRALCYRLAVASGLRYSEIAIIAPESFDWNAPSVTVEAAYTKNGETATLPLPTDLAADLAAYVAPLPPGKPIFPLPADKGAKMLRKDLAVAGIEYEDVSGLFFDFHSLRCQTATLADQAGISPRVVQKMMRHSSLELTGRYTRPRAVDIEAAAGMLPNLKPEGDRPEATFLTGTDSAPVSVPSAPEYATLAIVDESNPNDAKRFASMSQRSAKPSSPVRIRAAPF